MDLKSLSLIQRRNSASRLKAPGPSRAELVEIFKAAMRAPDHSRLSPWRFLVIEGEGRGDLGGLFADMLRRNAPDSSMEACQKIAEKTLRAPLIIVVIARITDNAKVPAIEQRISAGCAAQNILLAAEALGYGAILRTGAQAYDPLVCRGLGLAEGESIIGFIYMGTRDGEAKPLAQPSWEDFVRFWPEGR